MSAGREAPAFAEVISFSDGVASLRRRSLQRAAREVGELAFARADDEPFGFRPARDDLARFGLPCEFFLESEP
jgi:hypothetical protein